MDARDVAAEIRGAFPPGSETFLDWDDPDGPGPLVEALGQVWKAHGTDQAERLRLELNPKTATELVPVWEKSLGLQDTELARSGTIAQRRTQVITRLRETGATTVALIQSIVGPLLDYADPSQLRVLEVDRALLRAAHTYPWTGLRTFGVVGTDLAFIVRDDAKVSAAGAQVDITIAAPDLAQIGAVLTAPDGRQAGAAHVFSGIGRGPASGTYRLYYPELAGAQIRGRWNLRMATNTGMGIITAAGLFVEGFGRDAAGGDGLGAAKFYWGAAVEDAKLGPGANLKAAALAIQRINYATRLGTLVRRSRGMGALPAGQLGAIPDDPGSIPSACIPGP